MPITDLLLDLFFQYTDNVRACQDSTGLRKNPDVLGVPLKACLGDRIPHIIMIIMVVSVLIGGGMWCLMGYLVCEGILMSCLWVSFSHFSDGGVALVSPWRRRSQGVLCDVCSILARYVL